VEGGGEGEKERWVPRSTATMKHRWPNVVSTVGATLTINVVPALGMAGCVTLGQLVGPTLRQRRLQYVVPTFSLRLYSHLYLGFLVT